MLKRLVDYGSYRHNFKTAACQHRSIHIHSQF